MFSQNISEERAEISSPFSLLLFSSQAEASWQNIILDRAWKDLSESMTRQRVLGEKARFRLFNLNRNRGENGGRALDFF